MKRALPMVLKYLAIVAASCLLAFLVSHRLASAQEMPVAASNASTNADGRIAYTGMGAYRVETSFNAWTDATRKREVPIKIYFPFVAPAKIETREMKFPVILFSHGLGGNREGGKRWAAHWASHGYIVVVIQHPGSDESLWKDALPREIAQRMKAGMTYANLAARIDDVHFVIDEIFRRTNAREPALANADARLVGMSGHSFGAQTTLAVAGQRPPLAAGFSALDKRIASAIALSPNARNKSNLNRQFGEIKLPFFSVTGTDDGSILDDGTRAEHRRLPFENMPAGQKYLAVFDGGDHMVFGGHELGVRRPETARDRKIQLDVMAATLAFWNATLKQDAVARVWLDQGGFKSMIGASDVFEHK